MATYNVTAQTRRVQYTGDGTAGNFAFSFQINETSDLKVYVDSTEKTETTHYTVTLNSGTGAGTVAFTSGNFPTSSETVTLLSDIPLSRTSVYTSGGQLTASSLEDDFDTNMFIHQQTNEEVDRSLRLAEHDVISGADMTLPVKDTRKGKILGFNSTTGNPEASILTADAQTLADIASDIATLADIEDGTDATDAIQTVAGISSNVTTVAGISANVTTVAGISSDVTAVAGDATDIGTVATNIASVNTVATNIADVITVANDLNEAVSEVVTVADDLNEAVSEIDTVAGSISNVDTVGTNIANVNTVAGISSNVTTVAGVSANVTTVAGVSSDVTTVAGISSNVTTVAGDSTDIGTVATNIANVNTVAGVSGNVTTVAGISSNVTTVAGISSDVTAVAGDATDIGTVATDLTGSDNIGTVAGSISNVNSVGGSIANVNTVASNLASVNNFGEVYRIAASAPTTSLDLGDLYFDTTSDTLKVYGASGWQNAGSSINGTSQRYHYDITGTPTSVTGADANGNTLTYDAGYVDVYVNGVRMSTADVTVTSGDTVTFAEALADGDEVDIVGYGTFSVASLNADNLDSGTVPDARITGAYTGITNLTMSGNLTVDTNTLYVDSANNNVGIGTVSPSFPLSVQSNSNAEGLLILGRSGDDIGEIEFRENDNSTVLGELQYQQNHAVLRHRVGDLRFATGGTTERMRIDSSGNLLVSKTAGGSGTVGIQLESGGRGGFTKDNAYVTFQNRLSSDGEISRFMKDGTTVGSIGSRSAGNIYIDSAGESGRLQAAGSDVLGWYTGQFFPASDAGASLGTSGNRFSNLYLSGGVYLGGTGSANKLDDYEEGTWTPNIGGNATYGTQQGTYTKVGRMVFIWFNLLVNSVGTGSPNQVLSLPFTPAISNQFIGVAYYNSIANNTYELHFNARSDGTLRSELKTSFGTGIAAGTNWATTNANVIASGWYYI